MASYSGALAILKHGGETGKGEGALLQKSAARTLARWTRLLGGRYRLR